MLKKGIVLTFVTRFSDHFLVSTESDVCHSRIDRMDIGGSSYTVDNHNVYLLSVGERVTLISFKIIIYDLFVEN